MSKYLYPILFLIISGCTSLATSPSKEIRLPEVKEKKVNSTYINQAVKNKTRVGSRLGQNFDFFYGPGGSYFVVVSAPVGNRIKLTDYDVTLKIDSEDRSNPEQIQMALEDDQVAAGFGDFREGNASFELILTPISAELNPSFIFNFKLKIVPTL